MKFINAVELGRDLPKKINHIYSLGNMYFNGYFLTKNKRLGINLIEEAAKYGHLKAINFIDSLKEGL